jgi:hypothetical protein
MRGEERKNGKKEQETYDDKAHLEPVIAEEVFEYDHEFMLLAVSNPGIEKGIDQIYDQDGG